MGYSDMLLDFPDMGESEVTQITQNIFSGAVKMRTIIDELLLLASIRKMDDLQTRPLAMRDIVSDAVARLQITLEEAGAAIVVSEVWPTAIGYAAWIEEVWANYISNAIKYGGQPPQIELGASGEHGMVTFWVRDNGPGIPAEALDALFKQFSRLDTARAQGHGLGLSIVKSIITKLGGEVGATSAPGEGSTFYFTLPAAE
jgi:signal transduction histidine kinase